ncbi:MAG: GNAT family N-acetyltransferase [Chloroflexi bacterium]|nr:GNAT family N-acetyltransferase [Chloroflexota bacterium]
MAFSIRSFRPTDLEPIIEITVAAWQPIFASTREIVGEELFEIVHADPNARKREQVSKACQADDPRQVWIAESDSEIVGFITVNMDHDRKVAEIGNNAVSPAHHHKGIGARMYEFVLGQMKQAGMKAAIVTTGGDEAHAPARSAYEKVGFSGPVPSVEYHINF